MLNPGLLHRHVCVSLAVILTTRSCAYANSTKPQLQRQLAFKYRSRTSPASMASSLQYSTPIEKLSRAKHSASIIFLHGLGDSGNGWSDVGAQFAAQLPHVKFIFPTAPVQPVTVNMGMRMNSWYDIKSLDKVDAAEDEEGLMESLRYVQSLVQKEVDAGIPANRIVVSGFSQGGAVSLLQLRSDINIAGIACLSGYLPLGYKAGVVSSVNKGTPVRMWHGTADPVVQYKFGELSHEKLKAEGASVKFTPIPGMPHTAFPDELQQLLIFWQDVLPPLK